jgi:hypothetical protein
MLNKDLVYAASSLDIAVAKKMDACLEANKGNPKSLGVVHIRNKKPPIRGSFIYSDGSQGRHVLCKHGEQSACLVCVKCNEFRCTVCGKYRSFSMLAQNSSPEYIPEHWHKVEKAFERNEAFSESADKGEHSQCFPYLTCRDCLDFNVLLYEVSDIFLEHVEKGWEKRKQSEKYQTAWKKYKDTKAPALAAIPLSFSSIGFSLSSLLYGYEGVLPILAATPAVSFLTSSLLIYYLEKRKFRKSFEEAYEPVFLDYNQEVEDQLLDGIREAYHRGGAAALEAMKLLHYSGELVENGIFNRYSGTVVTSGLGDCDELVFPTVESGFSDLNKLGLAHLPSEALRVIRNSFLPLSQKNVGWATTKEKKGQISGISASLLLMASALHIAASNPFKEKKPD